MEGLGRIQISLEILTSEFFDTKVSKTLSLVMSEILADSHDFDFGSFWPSSSKVFDKIENRAKIELPYHFINELDIQNSKFFREIIDHKKTWATDYYSGGLESFRLLLMIDQSDPTQSGSIGTKEIYGLKNDGQELYYSLLNKDFFLETSLTELFTVKPSLIIQNMKQVVFESEELCLSRTFYASLGIDFDIFENRVESNVAGYIHLTQGQIEKLEFDIWKNFPLNDRTVLSLNRFVVVLETDFEIDKRPIDKLTLLRFPKLSKLRYFDLNCLKCLQEYQNKLSGIHPTLQIQIEALHDLGNLKELSHFKLSGVKFATQRHFADLIQTLLSMKNMKLIELNHINISENDIKLRIGQKLIAHQRLMDVTILIDHGVTQRSNIR